VRIITIGGLSIPSFWFGMLIMITLLYLFNWLPPITFTRSMSIRSQTSRN